MQLADIRVAAQKARDLAQALQPIAQTVWAINPIESKVYSTLIEHLYLLEKLLIEAADDLEEPSCATH